MELKNNNFIINDKRGVLIAFEGISGSGKSEGISKLTEQFDELGIVYSVVEWNSNQTIRNGVSWLSKKGLLTSLVFSMMQWFSFYIDYVRMIMPLLKQNHIVIADRYVYTALTRDAVNGAGRCHGWFLQSFVRAPDWLLFHNTDPDICHERIKARGKQLFHTNKRIKRSKQIEDKDLYYLNRSHNEYLQLIEKLEQKNNLNIVMIDQNNSCMGDLLQQYISTKRGYMNKDGIQSYSNMDSSIWKEGK